MGRSERPSLAPLGQSRSFMTAASLQKSQGLCQILDLRSRLACEHIKNNPKRGVLKTAEFCDNLSSEKSVEGSSGRFRGEKGGPVVFPQRMPLRGHEVIKPPAQAPDLTIADVLDRWFNVQVNRRNHSPAYIANVARCVSAWLDILPSKLIKQIISLDIEALYAARDDGKKGAAWLNTERAYLRCFWNWCLSHGLVEHDPTKAWPRIPKSRIKLKRKYRDVSREEEATLCETILEPQHWKKLSAKKRVAIARFVRLAIGTALRKRAIYGLRWGHLSSAGVLFCPAELDKTGKDREIPLPQKLIDCLGERQPDNKPLIANLPHRKNINVYLKKAAKIIGLKPEDIYPHQFRRTFVGRLHKKGYSVPQIMAAGGWSSYSVILEHYCSPLPEGELRDILEQI